MSTPPDPAVPSPRPAREQRALDLAMRVGVALGVIGLVMTAVIVVLYLIGATTPGTWAYAVAMLAPLGFGLILVTLVVVAVRRRRSSIGATQPADPGQPTP
jgi:hypothetical protein